MNVTQLAVLRCIDRRNGEPLMRVAKELELDRSSLYRALNPMIRKRWIRIKAGTDLRSRSALITGAGYAALEKAGRQWEDIQKRIVSKFGRERWARFVEDLQQLADCAVLAESNLRRAREDDR
jgi:DNA-binding MarR family transcriptional regulator